jgi:hypothetical protein
MLTVISFLFFGSALIYLGYVIGSEVSKLFEKDNKDLDKFGGAF